MTTKELIGYINNSSELTEDTKVKLAKSLDLYPYFQTARMLLTQNLYITDKNKFEEVLPKSAALCADRKQLFYLINREKYKDFLEKTSSRTSKDRTGEILDSYLDTFTSDSTEENVISTDSIISSDYMMYLQEGEHNEDLDYKDISPNELKHQDIIDNFLEKAETNEINLQPLQNENKKSTVPDAESVGNSFLTETLAKIYIKQKKYEQALTIIQQLSLNFPKKSAYFADQIRFLELLILNEKNK